jgi:hypothetical protein
MKYHLFVMCQRGKMFVMSKPDICSASVYVKFITFVTHNLKCVYACICICMHARTHAHTGYFLSPDQALQGRRHRQSLCSSDVVRSRASSLAIKYTLCMYMCVCVFSDFNGKPAAKEDSIKQVHTSRVLHEI